jgi:RNA polymerase sigma-70 factor (ECF subfamily)
MRHAAQLVPRDQAFEIAHDVAVELIDTPPGEVSGTLLYLRVTSRLRNLWRTRDRRAALDREYLEMRSRTAPAWVQPGDELEARELRQRLERVLAEMPSAMRQAFLLVREEELSYKEAAARLGVTVGTVHTQLSRANALFRECVERYQADAASAVTPSKRRHP